jgi:hypothetical protein
VAVGCRGDGEDVVEAHDDVGQQDGLDGLGHVVSLGDVLALLGGLESL